MCLYFINILRIVVFITSNNSSKSSFSLVWFSLLSSICTSWSLSDCFWDKKNLTNFLYLLTCLPIEFNVLFTVNYNVYAIHNNLWILLFSLFSFKTLIVAFILELLSVTIQVTLLFNLKSSIYFSK